MHTEQSITTNQNGLAERESSAHSKAKGTGEATTSTRPFTIVRLNKVIRGTPLFIIHGAGGGIGVFRKLGPKVKFPTYGVQDTPDAPISGSLGDLARFYLSKIKEIQPQGPYRLGGYSFGEFGCPVPPRKLTFTISPGCCIAFYMSNLLRKEGETVDRLIMLDASPAHFLLPVVQQRIRKGIIDGGLQDEVGMVFFF